MLSNQLKKKNKILKNQMKNYIKNFLLKDNKFLYKFFRKLEDYDHILIQLIYNFNNFLLQ